MARKRKKKELTIWLTEDELRLVKRFAYFHGCTKHTYIMCIIENEYYECEKIGFCNYVNTKSYNKNVKRDKSLTLLLSEYEMDLIHVLNRFDLSVIEVLSDYLYNKEDIVPQKPQKRCKTRNKRLHIWLTEKEWDLIHEVTKKQGLTITDFILKMAKENA